MESKNAVKAMKLMAAGFVLAPSLAMADSSALDALKATAGREASVQAGSVSRASLAASDAQVSDGSVAATPADPKSIEQLQAEVTARSWILDRHNRNIVTQADVENYYAAVKALNDALNPPSPAPSVPENIRRLQADVAARSWILDRNNRNIVTQADVDKYFAAVKALNDALASGTNQQAK